MKQPQMFFFIFHQFGSYIFPAVFLLMIYESKNNITKINLLVIHYV